MKIYVDIDGTICHTPSKGDTWDYTSSEPRYDQIQKINKLYNEGNKVIYWTARGSSSGIDWGEFTEQQLDSWGCRYSKIEKQKKPSYDLFICDKAKRIEEL